MLEAVLGKFSTDSLQKTAVFGTSHVIRKILQCETWSLSGGDQHWFKRSAMEKTAVTRENIIIIIITVNTVFVVLGGKQWLFMEKSIDLRIGLRISKRSVWYAVGHLGFLTPWASNQSGRPLQGLGTLKNHNYLLNWIFVYFNSKKVSSTVNNIILFKYSFFRPFFRPWTLTPGAAAPLALP